MAFQRIKAPQPYGTAGTDAWIRELARVTGREERAEAYIAKEHARIEPQIAKLRERLRGVRGYVATGSAYAHAMIGVLRELGVEVQGSLVFHHDPVYDSQDPRQDSLAHLIDNYGEVELNVANRQQYQFYALLQRAKPDFIIIRHNGLAPVASRLGIPSIPLGDEHHALGYQGIINMGESILDVLAQKKFHQDLAAHASLPYSRWWLEQQDPYILARKKSETQGAA
ncbi:MAG: nitrogenase component 1 [Polyangiaceae bacterium]